MNCKATLVISDDYGDNDCTFRCQLSEGHKGSHQEVFQEGKCTMTWEEDSRETCHLCGSKMEKKEATICSNFDTCSHKGKLVCKECIQKTGKGEYETDWCCCDECYEQYKRDIAEYEEEDNDGE